MKLTYMESPNKKKPKIPTEYLSPLNETPNARNRLHLIELLVIGLHGTPQTT